MAGEYDHSSDMAKAFEAGRSSVMHSPSIPAPSLTVSEIERLAKAGVTVDLNKLSVQSDAPQPYFSENKVLMDPLIHRLRTAFPFSEFNRGGRFQFMSAAYVGATEREDGSLGAKAKNVALMVVTVDGNAALLEDELTAWPSDALIAKLHLLLETEVKQATSDNRSAVNGAQASSPPPNALGRVPLPQGYGLRPQNPHRHGTP